MKGKPENVVIVIRNNGKEYTASVPEMVDMIIMSISAELGIKEPGMIECAGTDSNIKAYTLIDTTIEKDLEKNGGVLTGTYPNTHVVFISTYLESYYKKLVESRKTALNNVIPFVKAVH